MSWVMLLLAGVFEIGWAVGLKYTDGFSKLWPTIATGVSLVLSTALLGWAVKTIPVGTAYTVWTGLGAVGTVTLGVILFNEPASVPRLACIGLIVAGIAGLKFLG